MDTSFGNKGDEFMKKGDQKFKGGFFEKLVGNREERYEKANELYESAATNYKLAKRWEDAAKAYMRCVECHKQLKSTDAAEFLVKASESMQKVNSAQAIKYLEGAIEIYVQENRISNAAQMKKQIAEMYEKDFEFTLACNNYLEASELFYAENDHSSDYLNSKLKVADLGIQKPQIDIIGSIKIYEQVAEQYCENKLTEPSAKNLFFKAALLYILNDDNVGCGMALEKYIDKSPSFNGTRQYKFLVAVMKTVEENNVNQFSEECFQYNQIIPLDKWQTTVLNKIKQKLEKSQGLPNTNEVDDGGFL